jgi:hypothetical protein
MKEACVRLPPELSEQSLPNQGELVQASFAADMFMFAHAILALMHDSHATDSAIQLELRKCLSDSPSSRPSAAEILRKIAEEDSTDVHPESRTFDRLSSDIRTAVAMARFSAPQAEADAKNREILEDLVRRRRELAVHEASLTKAVQSLESASEAVRKEEAELQQYEERSTHDQALLTEIAWRRGIPMSRGGRGIAPGLGLDAWVHSFDSEADGWRSAAAAPKVSLHGRLHLTVCAPDVLGCRWRKPRPSTGTGPVGKRWSPRSSA